MITLSLQSAQKTQFALQVITVYFSIYYKISNLKKTLNTQTR